MNYLLSFKKAPKSLSGNNFWISLLFFSIILTGCDKKANNMPESGSASGKAITADSLLAGKLGTTSFIKVSGQFITRDFEEYAVCYETRSPGKAGIVFQIMCLRGDTLTTLYNSPVLDGALKHASFYAIQNKDSVFKSLYYDSGDFFMGSSSGEIYSYVLNPKTRGLIKGHLFMTGDKAPNLFISAPPASETEKNYLLKMMLDQFPNLKTVNKDKSID